MSLTAVIVIIILGIILLLLEFLIFPGVTVFGIGGFLFILFGIGTAYYYHGAQTGNYALLITVVLSVTIIFFLFKQKTWKKIGLESNITSHNVPFEAEKIHEGDSGKTITRMAPIGKIIVNDVICEGKSLSGFINENTDVVVVKVLKTQIIVKPK
jgi:membrane-bound ClpP family serine protease